MQLLVAGWVNLSPACQAPVRKVMEECVVCSLKHIVCKEQYVFCTVHCKVYFVVQSM